jgi:tail tape-measure protein
MSILGKLIVELKANTASFIEGLNGAAKTARTTGREIESSFASLGSISTSALGAFGPIGLAVGQTLDKIGQSAGSAVISMGKMGGAMGAVGAIAGGTTAAVGAVSLGALGLATHTALSIAKMGELAQSTGVAVGPLSGLAFVFKATGVDAEAGVKGIEKLDKAIFKAATSPPTAVNAFTRMGISVRDVQGNIKNADVVFAELAGKFSAMQDGSVKTALAMELFGRGGAAMVPALNKGKQGIEDLIDTAKVLGIYLDEETVQAAEHFKESLATVEAAGEGLANRLTRELLPAMQTVADFLVSGLKDKNSGLNAVIEGVVWLTKTFLSLGQTLFAFFQDIGAWVGNFVAYVVEGLSGIAKAADRAVHLDFSGALRERQETLARMEAIDANFSATEKTIWANNAQFIKGVFGQLPKATTPSGNRTTNVDTTPAKEDTTLARVQERIAALLKEADAYKQLASAGTQAEQLIIEATKKGNEEFGKLRELAARDKTGAALPFVLQNQELIKAAGANAVFGAAIKSVVADLDKQRAKFDEEGKAASDLAEAYSHGAEAIANAELDKKLAPQRAEVQRLADTYAKLTAESAAYLAEKAKLNGAAGPVPGQEVPQSELDTVKAGLDAAMAGYQRAKDALRAELSAGLTADLKQQDEAFQELRPKVDALSAAYLLGDDAVRKARIDLELYRFEQDKLRQGIILTTEQKQQERKILEEADAQAYDGALAQEAARYSLAAAYDNEIVKLERIREVIQENGQNTLLIDAQLQDAEDRLIHQWDEAAFKVGSFSDKFKGVMGELVIQGREAGAAISQAFVSAIDGIETNLAKLLTGQKANFKAVAQNLAETVTKAEIQKGVGSLAEHFGIKIPGLSGKPDGTASNPLHVVLSKSTAAAGKTSGVEEAIAKHRGIIGKLFGNAGGGPDNNSPDGTQVNPFYVISITPGSIGPASVPFGGGNLLTGFGIGSQGSPDHGNLGGGGSLLSLFSGFFADGGNIAPGKWGITGEKGPEVMFGGKSGVSVMPNSAFGSKKYENHFHYAAAGDRDLFSRTDRQNAARHMRNLRLASR